MQHFSHPTLFNAPDRAQETSDVAIWLTEKSDNL